MIGTWWCRPLSNAAKICNQFREFLLRTHQTPYALVRRMQHVAGWHAAVTRTCIGITSPAIFGQKPSCMQCTRAKNLPELNLSVPSSSRYNISRGQGSRSHPASSLPPPSRPSSADRSQQQASCGAAPIAPARPRRTLWQSQHRHLPPINTWCACTRHR